ncbi:MAG: GNAT family N-acetyltransferase [Bacilli bacterium]|nr:GNAT family N-acetyltransferase [Bacilli bacterium]
MSNRFDPFPDLRTRRVILRKMRTTDVQDLYEMRKDRRMNLYVDNIIDEDISETIEYFNRMNRGIDSGKWIIWGLELKSEARLIGSLSLWNFNKANTRSELGFSLSFDYHHQGYMTEALSAVIEYAFSTLKLEVLLAYTDIRNQSSVNLLERLNFIKTGEIEETGVLTNRLFQMSLYQLRNKLLK